MSRVSEIKELELLLYDCLRQACTVSGDKGDSFGVSTYARGLRFLARVGSFKIEFDCGRRVVGKWIDKGGER